MKKRNLKIPVAVAVILLAMGYLMYTGISDTGVYYRTVSEVLNQAAIFDGQNLRISGEVVPDTIRYDQENLLLSFTVRDTENDKVTMHARYQGVMPDAFKEDVEVILEGIYNQYDNLFNATILLAKCPSKYEAETPQAQQASQ
ncbi:MAG: cytochrome c maturation protein CcmE [bacterium]|nr:MAG: cytochrome c maturation protein CcmE [bacterium]